MVAAGRNAGRFAARHDHYDLLPQHLVDKFAKTTADA